MDSITRVKQLMSETLKHPYTIEQLCELIGECYHTFRKHFRRMEGITLSEYYQELRVQESKCLLRDSDKCIFEIAYEMGLSDEGNFTNWFKKKTGMTPTVVEKNIIYR